MEVQAAIKEKRANSIEIRMLKKEMKEADKIAKIDIKGIKVRIEEAKKSYKNQK